MKSAPATQMISRDRREARRARQAEQGRDALAAWLRQLDPALRRYVQGQPTINDFLDYSRAAPDRLRVYDAALDEYRRLAIRVPEEWRRHTKRCGQPVIHVEEQLLLGSAKRRGPPRLRVQERQDVMLAQAVDRAKERLSMGVSAYQDARRRGGFDSDVGAATDRLREMGYAENEISAITRGRTVLQAATISVALDSGRSSVESTRVMAARGRQMLRRAQRVL